MGGNVFKNQTKRVNKKEYVEICDKLTTYFNNHDIRHCIIPSYQEKDTFGDVDIIIDNYQNILDIPKYFNSIYIKNSNIVSFIVDDCQIDLINTPSHYYQSSIDYFSYNDLGNLLGRIGHKLGIKYGHKGLSIVLRDDNYKIKEIELTNNGKNVFYQMLGIEHHINTVPNTLEDIFKIVTDSKFFDKDIFLLDNRNHVAKIRDKKRKTYNLFLEHIKNIDSKYCFESKHDRGGYNIREPYFSEIICRHFNVKEQVDDVLREYEEHKKFNQEVKRLIDVDILKQITKLEGKEFGKWYGGFKQFVIDNYLENLKNESMTIRDVYHKYS